MLSFEVFSSPLAPYWDGILPYVGGGPYVILRCWGRGLIFCQAPSGSSLFWLAWCAPKCTWPLDPWKYVLSLLKSATGHFLLIKKSSCAAACWGSCLCQSSSSLCASASLPAFHWACRTPWAPEAMQRQRKVGSRTSGSSALPSLSARTVSLLCIQEVALSHMPATPGSLQVFPGSYGGPPLPGCSCVPPSHHHHCLLGFFLGSSTFVSSCLALLTFSSTSAIHRGFLLFPLPVLKEYSWGSWQLGGCQTSWFQVVVSGGREIENTSFKNFQNSILEHKITCQ